MNTIRGLFRIGVVLTVAWTVLISIAYFLALSEQVSGLAELFPFSSFHWVVRTPGENPFIIGNLNPVFDIPGFLGILVVPPFLLWVVGGLLVFAAKWIHAGFRREKPPATAMDNVIKSVYGSNANKTANVLDAIALVSSELLRGKFDKKEIADLATALDKGPVPYSTHDLAASVALGLLRKAPKEARKELFDVQLTARLTVGTWAAEGKVAKPLAEAFEQTLYRDYHPDRLV